MKDVDRHTFTNFAFFNALNSVFEGVNPKSSLPLSLANSNHGYVS